MKELNIDLIKGELQYFKINEWNSYINTYPEFIKYFEEIDIIEKHNLIIASHFVYGWMPTIITLNQENLSEVLRLLNKVKNGHILDQTEVQILKSCINNSLVGLSKLLHFIRPDLYAIWDSRIFKFLTGKKSTYGISNPRLYMDYLKRLKEITEHADFENVFCEIKNNFKYPISKLRAIEILLYQNSVRLTLNKKNDRL